MVWNSASKASNWCLAHKTHNLHQLLQSFIFRLKSQIQVLLFNVFIASLLKRWRITVDKIYSSETDESVSWGSIQLLRYLESWGHLSSYVFFIRWTIKIKDDKTESIIGKADRFICHNRTWWTVIQYRAPPQWFSRWHRCRPRTSWCPSFWPWWLVGSMPLKRQEVEHVRRRSNHMQKGLIKALTSWSTGASPSAAWEVWFSWKTKI